GPDHRLRMVPLVGAVAPLRATAGGKVWLASLSEAEATAALTQQGLARLAPRTITSRARLLAQLRGIRAQGYAIVDEELVAGGRAVAVPVIRGDGVVGSVAVSGPTFRVPVHKLHRMAPQLKRAAVELAAVWPHEGEGTTTVRGRPGDTRELRVSRADLAGRGRGPRRTVRRRRTISRRRHRSHHPDASRQAATAPRRESAPRVWARRHRRQRRRARGRARHPPRSRALSCLPRTAAGAGRGRRGRGWSPGTERRHRGRQYRQRL